MSSFSRKGFLDQHRWLISLIQRLLDGGVSISLLALLSRIYGIPFNLQLIVLSIISFLLIFIVFKGFQIHRSWRGANFLFMAGQIIMAWLLVNALLLGIAYATRSSSLFSRRLMLTWFFLSPLSMLGLRFIIYLGLNWLRSTGRNTRKVIIAGAGDLAMNLANKIVTTPWLGMHLVGFFDDQKSGKIELEPETDPYPILGTLDEMVEFAKREKIEIVYLALPMRSENRLRQVALALQDTTVSLYFIPDIFIFSLLQSSFSDLKGIPLISLYETPFYGVNSWLKRVEDIILASIILLCLWPLMLFIALGIKLSSPGPVIFKQRRYGLNGEEILVYKFRSMTVCQDGSEVPIAVRNDPRTTPFGAFLRHTSLDELPQFLNVLQGAMSVVGPRPHAVAHNETYRGLITGYMLRHKIRPGLTGLAQVKGWRGEADTLEKMKERIECDLEYIRTWSLWLDLKIIFRTAFQIFHDKNAY